MPPIKLKPDEKFLPVPYTANYFYISNYGRVYSKKHGGIMSTYRTNRFTALTLFPAKDQLKVVAYSIPRLVLRLFRPGVDPARHVVFLDKKSTNTHVDNLAWSDKVQKLP